MVVREPARATASSLLSTLLSSLLFLALCACQGSGAQGGPPGGGGPGGPPAKVKLLALRTEEVKESADFLAEINSRRSVTIFSQVPGYVRAVLVKPGEKVKTGAPIVQVDAAQAQAATESLQAIRAARQAAVATAQDRFERAQKLAPAGVIPQQDLDQAANALAAARAELTAAEAQVQAQSVQLGFSRVKAPFDGVVGDVLVKVGELISPQTPITALNQASALEAYVNVPAHLAGKVGPETVIELLNADGKPMASGKVDFVSPAVKPDTQSVLLRTVVGDDARVRFAQLVPARVTWGSHPGLLVPVGAVLRRSGQTFVFVAEAEGNGQVAKQRLVKLGPLLGNAFEVLEGLKAGERIVVSGVQKVQNDAPLQPEAGT